MGEQENNEGPEHTQVWFGPESRPLYGWVSRPAGGVARGGAILCPPMGEEGRAAHRTFRRLAEELAGAGIVALRFDYDGTGDSAGLQDDPDRVRAWQDSIEAARQYLLDLGAPSVAAVGMRLGATLAAAQAADPESPGSTGPFSSLVCWDPCLSGRTFLREGEALYGFGETAVEAPDDGLRHTPGFQYDAATAKDLRTLDLGKVAADRRLADRVLLLTRDDRPVPPAMTDRLEQESLETGAATGQGQLLDVPPELSVVPEDALRRVVAWLTAGVDDQPAEPVKAPDGDQVVLVGSGPGGSLPVREHLTRLGPDGIVGLVDEPVDPSARGENGPAPWVVLVNVAAEHHIGPGRRWVEWARSWAASGYRVVRIDQSGVGDSPTRPGGVDDRAFAPEWIDDMRHVVTDLAGDGARVGIVGLCSGSYSALEVAMWEHVDAVFAINPRLTLYPAAKGTPVYTDRRRAAMLPNAPFARLARRRRILAGGLWRIYRELAVWHAPLLVLWRVLRRGTAVEVVACHDDAQHFTEVYALRPLFWRMRRHRRFAFTDTDVIDHSLLSRRAQLAAHERATAFLDRYLTAKAAPVTDLISLLDLDPAAYAVHPIHGDERTYSETNCYVDCLVELLHASGLEPEAMLGGAVAVDFELDQWTFFKPSPDDLFRLYGIDLHEVQAYRGFPTLIASRLAAGQTVMPEVDSFYLPDVAATAYRTDHVKSTIIAESIDEEARRLRYFHNTGYHELSGEDYDKLFATYSGDGHLPTYVELVRLGAGPVPTGDSLKAVARELLAGYLARRPADNPFTRFAAQLEADLPALIAGSTADYNAYAFHNPRMVGASMELLAGHVRWLFAEDGQSEGEKAAAHLDDVVGGSKMLLFRLARQRAFDVAGVVAPMAEAYDAAVTELDSLVG